MSSLTRHYIGKHCETSAWNENSEDFFFSLDLGFSSLEVKRLIEQDI